MALTDERKFTHDFLVSVVLRFSSAGITFGFVALLARLVSVEDYGIIGTIMAVSLLFSVIGSVGQQTTLLRFVPPALENGPESVQQKVSAHAFRLAILGNLTVFGLLEAGVALVGTRGLLPQWEVVLVGIAIVPLTGLVDMQSHLARAHGFVMAALLPKDILWRLVSGIIFLVVLVAVPGERLSLFTVLSVLVGVLSALVLGFGSWLRKRTSFGGFWWSWRSNPQLTTDSAQYKAKVPFWVTSISSVLFTNLDVVAVGVLFGAEPAALYFAANRVAMLPRLFLMSQIIVVGPVFASHHAAARTDHLQAIARSATMQAFLPTFACCALLFTFAEQVLWIFGPEFTEAAKLLQILLVAGVFNAALGPTDLAMKMCGHERMAMVAAVTGMIGGAIILGTFGVIGDTVASLAYGALASIVFAKLVSWALAYRMLGFSADALTAALLWHVDRRLANKSYPSLGTRP